MNLERGCRVVALDAKRWFGGPCRIQSVLAGRTAVQLNKVTPTKASVMPTCAPPPPPPAAAAGSSGCKRKNSSGGDRPRGGKHRAFYQSLFETQRTIVHVDVAACNRHISASGGGAVGEETWRHRIILSLPIFCFPPRPSPAPDFEAIPRDVWMIQGDVIIPIPMLAVAISGRCRRAGVSKYNRSVSQVSKCKFTHAHMHRE